MGTITSRKRKDNSTTYSARISIMSKGKIVHREAKTFDRRKITKLWIANREDELIIRCDRDRKHRIVKK